MSFTNMDSTIAKNIKYLSINITLPIMIGLVHYMLL